MRRKRLTDSCTECKYFNIWYLHLMKPQDIVRLRTYLKRKKIAHRAFAKRIGRSEASVSRYAALKNWPDGETIVRIYVASEGAVKPNDHFRLPPRSAGPAPAQAVDANSFYHLPETKETAP
jgi:hypothetical protein